MIALFTMPDDSVAYAGWLDRQLLGPDLPSLVAELRAIHKPGPKPKLDDVLAESRTSFLEQGFAALPQSRLRKLLRNPDLLLELPDLIYAEGSNFWFSEPLTQEEVKRAEKIADRVHAALKAEVRPASNSSRWVERTGWILALAASVVVAIFVTSSLGKKEDQVASAGWGFNKVSELPASASAREIYTELADQVDEFPNKPLTDAFLLAKRLTEFRLGCSKLQRAKLPLPPEESQWLKTECTRWAALIDGHLRDLDSTGDVQAVREATLKTIKDISRELRERAA